MVHSIQAEVEDLAELLAYRAVTGEVVKAFLICRESTSIVPKVEEQHASVALRSRREMRVTRDIVGKESVVGVDALAVVYVEKGSHALQ
ncbi:hypothetical protein Sgou_18090 [Streptomyces gougerotii]|uniref:Uncharacterized protein n=1 Tax=Streptomyces gougerotii TaxID=53448 RepID=A0A8H9HTF5_9ACTN|nr:hypothetical protein Sgou_18090 [Streptomyces gougerotii]GGU87781.1 hypothetical protein GCM10010227_47990 [Streptomyces gougerotii]